MSDFRDVIRQQRDRQPVDTSELRIVPQAPPAPPLDRRELARYAAEQLAAEMKRRIRPEKYDDSTGEVEADE